MPVRITVGPADPTPARTAKPKPQSPASRRRRQRSTTPPAPTRLDAVAANDTTTESEDTE